MQHVIDAFDNRPLVHVKDRKYIINPLTDHYPTTSFALLDETVSELIKLTDFSRATKILGEEERGGFIASLVAYATKLPFGMVKWNPTGLEGQLAVDFRMSYAEGKLYLNGVEPGDKVVIVEDMVDSGGTMIAMINLLRRANIELLDVIVVAEKEEFHGIERIKRETGVQVKHLVGFDVSGERSKVTWTRAPLARGLAATTVL
jgi:adenine/guanine phosphoribosyltransferase-like PRPP-binding protein